MLLRQLINAIIARRGDSWSSEKSIRVITVLLLIGSFCIKSLCVRYAVRPGIMTVAHLKSENVFFFTGCVTPI